jgi:hypothetical protein
MGRIRHVAPSLRNQDRVAKKRLRIQEEDEDGQTASGTPKHWHVFHIIAQRSDGRLERAAETEGAGAT